MLSKIGLSHLVKQQQWQQQQQLQQWQHRQQQQQRQQRQRQQQHLPILADSKKGRKHKNKEEEEELFGAKFCLSCFSNCLEHLPKIKFERDGVKLRCPAFHQLDICRAEGFCCYVRGYKTNPMKSHT